MPPTTDLQMTLAYIPISNHEKMSDPVSMVRGNFYLIRVGIVKTWVNYLGLELAALGLFHWFLLKWVAEVFDPGLMGNGNIV